MSARADDRADNDEMCTACGHHRSHHGLPVPDDDGSCHHYGIGSGSSCPCPAFETQHDYVVTIDLPEVDGIMMREFRASSPEQALGRFLGVIVRYIDVDGPFDNEGGRV